VGVRVGFFPSQGQVIGCTRQVHGQRLDVSGGPAHKNVYRTYPAVEVGPHMVALATSYSFGNQLFNHVALSR
jgi:hypothetical protein